MTFIIIVIITIYALLIVLTWHSQEEIKKTTKVIIIVVGILIIYLITLLIFNISKNGIEYPSQIIKSNIANIILGLFTGLNGLISLPFIAKLLSKIDQGEIEKNKLSKTLIIFSIIFITCMILEVGYIKNIQQGILSTYNLMKQ